LNVSETFILGQLFDVRNGRQFCDQLLDVRFMIDQSIVV